MWTFGLWRSADAPGGDAPAVVEAAPAAPEAPAAEVAHVETPAPQSEPTPAWNGEIEHLSKQPWFTALPEDVRTQVEGGVKEKVKNLESGYGKKFNELAEMRKSVSAWETEKATLLKSWEEERTGLTGKLNEASERAEMFQEVFGADDATLKARFDAVRAEAVKPYEEKVRDLDALRTEVETLRSYKGEIEAKEKAAYEATVAAEVESIKAKLADLPMTDDALDKLHRLVEAGEPFDDALAYVKRKFDIKAPTMPAAAANASRGDGPAGADTAPKGLSWQERLEWAVNNAARKTGAGA